MIIANAVFIIVDPGIIRITFPCLLHIIALADKLNSVKLLRV